MLYIVRKLDESIIINNNIEIKVISVKRNGIKLGIDFPNSATVLRKEVYEKMHQTNIDALDAFDIDDKKIDTGQ